jgi:hypothetical protein
MPFVLQAPSFMRRRHFCMTLCSLFSFTSKSPQTCPYSYPRSSCPTGANDGHPHTARTACPDVHGPSSYKRYSRDATTSWHIECRTSRERHCCRQLAQSQTECGSYWAEACYLRSQSRPRVGGRFNVHCNILAEQLVLGCHSGTTRRS